MRARNAHRAWRMAVLPLSLITVVLAGGSAGGEQTRSPTHGRVKVIYEDNAIKPEDQAAVKLMRDSGVLERVAAWTNKAIVQPRDIPITVTDALPKGVPDSPTSRAGKIFLPASWLTHTHDLLAQFVERVNREGAPEKVFPPGTFNADALTVGANEFTIGHEVGHALIDQLDLPMPGKEENAADGFAAFLTVDKKVAGPMPALGAAALFDELARQQGPLTADSFANDADLLQQRTYNFLCFLLGNDPTLQGALVGNGGLPESRAPDCRADWTAVNFGWWSILEPHLTNGFRADGVKALEKAHKEWRAAIVEALQRAGQ